MRRSASAGSPCGSCRRPSREQVGYWHISGLMPAAGSGHLPARTPLLLHRIQPLAAPWPHPSPRRKRGIHRSAAMPVPAWIPAFAGMTMGLMGPLQSDTIRRQSSKEPRQRFGTPNRKNILDRLRKPPTHPSSRRKPGSIQPPPRWSSTCIPAFGGSRGSAPVRRRASLIAARWADRDAMRLKRRATARSSEPCLGRQAAAPRPLRDSSRPASRRSARR